MDAPLAPLRALFGSETGNAKQVAHDPATAATARGLDVTLSALGDCTPEELARQGCVLIVAATTGDGEVTYDALLLWEALEAPDAPRAWTGSRSRSSGSATPPTSTSARQRSTSTADSSSSVGGACTSW